MNETSHDDGIDDRGGDSSVDDSTLDDGFDDDGAANDIAYLGELGDMTDEDVAIVRTLFGGLDGELSPEVGQQMLSRYSNVLDEYVGRQQADDLASRDVATAELRRAWGSSYDANMRELRAAVDSQPFADEFNDARLPDGRLLWNQPEVAKWMHGLLRGSNMTQQSRRPAPANRQALQREKHEIEEVMRVDRPKYVRDERMQARYLEVIEQLGIGEG